MKGAETMQQREHIRNRLRRIAAATIALLFFVPATTWAYSTSQSYYSTRSFYSNGYYSTKYGWVGPSPRYVVPTPTPAPVPIPSPTPVPQPAPTGVLSAEERQMVELVNQERAKAGLAPLTVVPQLVEIARIKSRDMVTANYFGHNSPNFGSTFNLVKQWGIPYTYGGENLAGAADVLTAHRMLMASPGHRANILNPRFNRMGIGIVRGGPYG
ncbi:MAG: CAP domain-containing protein, partial [Firmicutes bacterium]|nr:CAP domain-containing protein [Bacillota bacterium]